MQNKQQKDFFTLYHARDFRKYIFSGITAFVFAFTFVALYHGNVDLKGLMASVTNVVRAPQYDADLIVERTNQQIKIVLGTSAQGVDKVEFTLLSDPARFRGVTTTNSRATITAQPELGAYRISLLVDGDDVVAGTLLMQAAIDLDNNVALSVTDVAFVSGDDRYNLTSQVK